MKKKIEFLLILLCCCGFCTAQQVVSSGGYATKSDVSVNWILGGSLSDIPAIRTNIINQNNKEQLKESPLPLKVYPVPTTDFINIEIALPDTGRISLEMYTYTGVKVLSQNFYYQPQVKLYVANFLPGIYYLKISRNSSENPLSIVEKIIKN